MVDNVLFLVVSFLSCFLVVLDVSSLRVSSDIRSFQFMF